MGVVRDFARRFTEPIDDEGVVTVRRETASAFAGDLASQNQPPPPAHEPPAAMQADTPAVPPVGFAVTQAGYALFYDRDERTLFYTMSWPHPKPPVCPATNTTGWVILNRRFILSRQDRWGNWVFRCE